MNQSTIPLVAMIGLSHAFALTTLAVDKPLEAGIQPFLGQPQLEMQALFGDERFPNVVVTTKGTVVATWGSKGVKARRSEDGGKNWGPEIVIADPGFHGGGTTVDENSGDILAFVEDQHPPAPLTIYRSQDDGKTWTAANTTIHPDIRGNVPSMHMNEHGITLSRGQHKGRLVRPSRYYGKKNAREEWATHYTNAIYSDDGGKTWHSSHPFPENGTGEAAVVELADGSLYYNSRVHWQERPNNRRRRGAVSTDGGQTWKDWHIVEILPDGPQDTSYGCMGGLTRLPIKGRDILIYSNCDSPKGRHHGTLWASFDGGKTWPVKRLLSEEKFAYSSLTTGRSNTPSEGWIYLHFEGGPTGASTIARFNLAWLLKGTPTGDGSIPAPLKR
ncbi:MAG: Sialidase [Verrucomicrobia subdivision 3 bacterium]|nr:Sialidase [Limisphaerales bacterium]MCS1416734.1 Sialidase [Limisphaerales bacterium]